MRIFRGTVSGFLLFALLALAGVSPTAAATPAWVKAPVVPAFGKQDRIKLKARVTAGEKLGLRSGVFAKVGDSNTEFAPNFYGLACRQPVGLPADLRKTLVSYNRVRIRNPRSMPDCLPNTSFSRRSAAAQAGVFTTWSLSRVGDLPDEGYWEKPSGCGMDTTPLDCEVSAIRPRYALVLLGTNDLGMDLYFELVPGRQTFARMSAVVRRLLDRGVIPVLSTIPPVTKDDPVEQQKYAVGVARTNAAIWKLSRIRRLPLVNLWRAMQAPAMIDLGLADDGVHFSVAGADGRMVGKEPEPSTLTDSVNFTPGSLRYGANRHNLIWLKTLARLDRITG